MKPLLLTLLLLLPLNAHADYWQLNVRYKCPKQWVTAQYKFRSLARAREAQETFRKIPKYRNCWIRLVRER